MYGLQFGSYSAVITNLNENFSVHVPEQIGTMHVVTPGCDGIVVQYIAFQLKNPLIL